MKAKKASFKYYSSTIADMVTTIQLHEDIKFALSKMKRSANETYEEVIIRLIKMVNQEKKNKEILLRQGYKEMADLNTQINNEWSSADTGWD